MIGPLRAAAALAAPVIALLLLLPPAPARGGAGSLALSVDLPTGEVFLGDPVTLTVTIERDAALAGTVEVERPRFPGFRIERYEPGAEETRAGRIRRTDRTTLLPAAAGTFEIEIPGFTFRSADGRDLVVAPERRRVVVRDVPDWVIDAIDVRDIRPPGDLPRAPRPADRRMLLAAAALLAALLAARLLSARRGREGPSAAPPPPPVDPWKEFDEAMRRLAGSGLLQRGECKEYIERLSLILRGFIGRRFGVNAPDMTGEELLDFAATRGGRFEERIARFVEESDLVKFARAPVERFHADELRELAEAVARDERAAAPGGEGR